MGRKFSIKSLNMKFELPDKNNNVYIVGADTYLGLHFAKYWLAAGGNVFACGMKSHLPKELESVAYTQTDYSSWNLTENKYDWIMLCLDPSMARMYYLNTIGSLCDHLDGNRISVHICFPSSFMMCEAKNNRSIPENSKLIPHSEYEMNLAMAELYLNMRSYNLENDILTYVVRMGEIYGNEFVTDADMSAPGLINSAWNAAINGNPIKMYGLGEKKRTVTYIADACCFAIKYMNLDFAPREINVPGEKMRIVDFLTLLAEHYKVDTPLASPSENATFFNRFSGNQTLSENHAKKVVKYECKVTFRQWLASQKGTIQNPNSL